MLSKLSQFILELYRASHELAIADFQNWTFRRLKGVLPFDSGLWLEGTLAPDGNTAAFHTRYLFNQPPQLLSDWSKCDKEGSPFTRKVFSSPGTTFRCTPAVDMGPALAEHARRYGIEQILATSVRDQASGIQELISLYRSSLDHAFNEEDRLLQQELVPHLSEAWRQCRLRHLSQLSQPQCQSNTHGAGADRNGLLRTVDSGFTRLLRDEWPNWIGPALPAILTGAHALAERRYVGAKVTIHLFPHEDHLFLRARPLLPIDCLSKRERAVAEKYAAGHSHKEIAKSLELSPVTIRNYLSSIYAKLGVNSKAMLANAMAERS